jgi:hypothetical protein
LPLIPRRAAYDFKRCAATTWRCSLKTVPAVATTATVCVTLVGHFKAANKRADAEVQPR